MSVSEPNLTASEMSAVSLLETFAAVARRRAGVGSGGGAAHTSGGSSVSSTNSINISRSQVQCEQIRQNFTICLPARANLKKYQPIH